MIYKDVINIQFGQHNYFWPMFTIINVQIFAEVKQGPYPF